MYAFPASEKKAYCDVNIEHIHSQLQRRSIFIFKDLLILFKIIPNITLDYASKALKIPACNFTLIVLSKSITHLFWCVAFKQRNKIPDYLEFFCDFCLQICSMFSEIQPQQRHVSWIYDSLINHSLPDRTQISKLCYNFKVCGIILQCDHSNDSY